MELIKTIACAGALLVGGVVVKRIYDHQQFLAYQKRIEEQAKTSNDELDRCFIEMQKILNDVKRKQLDPIRIENMKLVKEYGFEKAEQIRWEEMNRKKD